MTRIRIESTEKAERYQQLAKQHGTPLLVLDCEQLEKQYHK